MSRYINKYDKAINKYIDAVYLKIKGKKDLLDSGKIIKSIIVDKIVKDESKNKDIEKISVKILKYYIFLYYLFINYSKVEALKNKLLVEKVLTSEELVDILNLLESINLIKKIVNMEDKEKLIEEISVNESYKQIIDYLNNIGGDFIMKYLVGDSEEKNNNIIQTVILRYYRSNFRKKVFEMINHDDNDKYKFIEIIVPVVEIIDHVNIESVLDTDEIRSGYVDDIFELLKDTNRTEFEGQSDDDKINKLFQSKYVFPIVHDFLRYHKVTEKYDNQSSNTKIKTFERSNAKDQTKIRYIITKIDKIKDYYSKKIQNNKKLVMDIQKMFYKPLEYRNAILYNELEEINIINKLKKQGKTAIESNEYYFDLVKLRDYSYVYFKDFKKYGISTQINKTTSAVRYSSIRHLEKSGFKSTKDIETRVIFGGTKGKMIGLVFSNDNIMNLNNKNILDLSKSSKSVNKDIVKLLRKFILENDKKTSNKYLIFDPKRDSDTLELFERRVTDQDSIKFILLGIYNNLLLLTYEKILSEMNKKDDLTFYEYDQILHDNQSRVRIPQGDKLRKLLDNKFLEKIKRVEDLKDTNEDKLYGIQGDVVKIPKVKYVDNSVPEVVIPYLKTDEEAIDFDTVSTLCQHIIDWIDLKKIKSRDPNKHNDLLVQFIKKYSVINKDNQYICKSCKQLLDIQSYLTNPYTGGSEGIDIILTTTRPLNELKQYSKFNFAIKNMSEMVKRIAQVMNISYYMGNEQIYKLRRHDVIKNTIDLVNIHNSLLKSEKLNKKHREMNASKNYNISFDYSNYFVFPIENNIFQFSTEDIDKFKKIKINSIVAYIILFMLLEINPSQVLSFEFNKYCNLFFYEKFGKSYFSNLYIRINNSNDVRKLSKYPTLCFIIYYFACMVSRFKIWWSPDEKPNPVLMQKSVVHTLVDLINSFMEVYERKKKNFLYDVIGTKFANMLSNYLNNGELLKMIKARESSKMVITNNKIKFIKSKIQDIDLDGKYHPFKDLLKKHKTCIPSTYVIDRQLEKRKLKKTLGSELKQFNEQLELSNKKSLSKIYDEDGNIRKFRLTQKEVDKLSATDLKKIVNNLKRDKNVINASVMEKVKCDDSKKKYNEIESGISKEKNYLGSLLKIIKTSIGNRVKINKVEYLVDTDRFLFDHDFLGNTIKNNFYLNVNDVKVKAKYSENLGKKVYIILDKMNNVSIYYDYYTYNLIGYKESNKNLVVLTSLGRYLRYIPSIETIIKTMGFKKFFYNFENEKELNKIYRARVINVKKLIQSLNTILNQIKNRYVPESSDLIVKYYIDKINRIQLSGNGKSVFENWESYVIHKRNRFENNNKIKYGKNVSMFILSEVNESNTEIINYVIQQLLLLANLNNDKFVRSNIIYMLLSKLVNAYFYNFSQYMKVDLIKYSYVLDFTSCSDFRNSNTYTADEISGITEEEKAARINSQIDADERSSAFDVSNEGDYDSDEEEMLIEDPETN